MKAATNRIVGSSGGAFHLDGGAVGQHFAAGRHTREGASIRAEDRRVNIIEALAPLTRFRRNQRVLASLGESS